MEALNKKLCDAVEYGNIGLVQDCLQKGADVNYKGLGGETPLHMSAARGKTDVTNVLLEAGASLSAVANDGRTPLHLSLVLGKADVRNVLLEAGASLSVVDKWGRTPLHLSLVLGKADVTNVLLEAGASLSVVDKWGRTPLHVSAERGKADVTNALLEAGASLSVVDKWGETPLHMSAERGKADVTNVLLEAGASLSVVDKLGKTPHDVAHANVKKLLQDWEYTLQTGIPLEVKQLDAQSAAVFTNLIKEESYIQFEARAMLLGEKGTGKTTVARFLVGKGPTKVRISTEGIDLYTALAFIDRETDEWLNGKQDFILEDILVSRSLRQAIDPMIPELPDTPVIDPLRKLTPSSLPVQYNTNVSVPTAAGTFIKLQQSSLNEPENKEVSIHTDAGASSKLQQSSLNEPEKKEASVPIAAGIESRLGKSSLHDPENREVSVPTAAAALNEQGKSALHNPENKEVSVPSTASVVRKTSIIDSFKSFFGVKKELNEIKISITQREFLKKSWKVGKKKLNQRKIVPVIIWDFGGQDVFYSTHQTFLTYRAIYMLVLDGSRTLDEPCRFEQYLPGKGGAKTQRDYVRFWTNTIVTYCKGSGEGYPKIMVILTHKDKIKASAVLNRRLEIFSGIKKMFEGTRVASHLVIDDQIFVNARDKTDPGMEEIKKTIIQQAKHQPTWGQTLPKCFLALELEIAAQVRKGVALITLDDWKKINAQQAIRPLTDTELKVFLKFHHAVGTILYFDELNLDQHIILMPTHMIDAFKSIITDKIFCKGDRKKEQVWDIMDSKGIILKQDVDQIWRNKKYSKFRKEKDYLLAVMTHLDILVEPKRYDPHSLSRIPTDFYYVASMIRKLDNTGYLQSPDFYQRNIAIVFDMYGTIIPPALSFRFISYCLSIWGVKTYGETREDMLFHKSAVFTIDQSLDMYVQCEDEHIIVRLVHAKKKALIVSDLASSIRECLISALHKISRLYINTSSDKTEVDVGSFRLQVCCSSPYDPCFLPLEEERILDGIWRCPTHHMEIGEGVLLSWSAEKEHETCKPGCPVTNDEFLEQRPTDRHLQRLSLEYDNYEVFKIIITSGLSYNVWCDVSTSTEFSIEMKRFEGLKLCCEKNALTFKDLKEVVEKEEIRTPHTICKVLRDKFIDYDLEPEKWDRVLTDKYIDKLAPLVGSQSLQFLLELDMTFQDWEQIKYRQPEKDLVRINCDILEAWKHNCHIHSVRPTLRHIGRAFGNIGKHIKIIENTLFD